MLGTLGLESISKLVEFKYLLQTFFSINILIFNQLWRIPFLFHCVNTTMKFHIFSMLLCKLHAAIATPPFIAYLFPFCGLTWSVCRIMQKHHVAGSHMPCSLPHFVLSWNYRKICYIVKTRKSYVAFYYFFYWLLKGHTNWGLFMHWTF